jgi:hypothetical protein
LPASRLFVGTGPSSYKKRIYRAAVSQRLRNTDLENMGGPNEEKQPWEKGGKFSTSVNMGK